MNSLILIIHITTGSLAVITGFLSLIPRKGSRRHILIGKLFFYSMAGMAIAASYLAIFSSFETINAVIGLFTLYLVVTARWAASNNKGGTTVKEKIGGIFSTLIFLGFLLLAIRANESGKPVVDGVYVEAFYVFTILAGLLGISGGCCWRYSSQLLLCF